MASLTRKPNGSCTIGFTDPDGKPRWIYPGNMPRKAAETVLRHVEALLAAKIAGAAVPADTAKWLTDAGDVLYGRLAHAGLVPHREKRVAPRLGELCRSYVARRTDLKPRSVTSLDRAVTSLTGYFGADRDYTTLTRAEMADWKRDGLTKFSAATVANDVKKARQIFADAVDRGLMTSNPLAGVRAGSQSNPARLHYVPAGTVLKVMQACGDAEWSLLFALARFGGLRTPSETAALRWPDVDWEAQRITVTSPKGERHGKGKRMIPLFHELYAPLLKMWEQTPDRAGYVLPTLRGENLATHGDRLVRRAGFEPWERTFQNLRASRETDLARIYPIQVVCAWIGNTPAVAVAHYLSVTEEDFQKAAGAANGAPAADSVGKVFGERHPNKGAGTAEQSPKMGSGTAPAGIQWSPETRGIRVRPVPALDFALSAFPPESSATHLHAFAEEVYARAAARVEGTVARG